MYKKGAEGGNFMMIFIFGFILFIIVGGIAIGFGMFYGQPLDYRTADASLLFTKVARCLSENPLTDTFFNSFYANCGIAEDVIKNQKMTLVISQRPKDYLSVGDPVQCQLSQSNIGNENYPRCVIRDITVSLNGQQTTLHIIAGSNQEASAQ